MKSRKRRGWLIGVLILVAAGSCRKKAAPVEELFSTRMLGLSYLQRNQLPEAEAQFKKLIELAPDDPLGYADLGLSYLQAGQYQDAEKQLRRAHELDPRNADIDLALAKLYSLTGRVADAQKILEQARQDARNNAHVLYALAELETGSDTAALARKGQRLREVLAVSPANLAVRLELLDIHLRRGESDSAVRQLEEMRRTPPEPPAEARAYLDSAVRLLQRGQLAAAEELVARFSHLMQLTKPYQASLDEVRWTEGPVPGRPVLTFNPKYLIGLRGVRTQSVVDSVRFTDVTDNSGLLEIGRRTAAAPAASTPAATPTALAIGDVDGDGTNELLLSVWSAEQQRALMHLVSIRGGFLRDITAASGIALPNGAVFATFADYDNDGWLDLFTIDAEGRASLLHNHGNGTFEDVTSKAGIADVKGARRGVFVDLDHDGDLDLLLIGNGPRTLYRNNLDGTFTDVTAAYGVVGSGDARSVAFGDFDGDGRIDLFITNANGSNVLLHNGGAQRFTDVTAASGLTSSGGSGAAAVGDYNNDGFLDLFVGGVNGVEPALWLNNGDGTFRRDPRSAAVLGALRRNGVADAIFVDYDNDGWLDLLAVSSPAAEQAGGNVFLFRNDGTGRFVDRSSLLPSTIRSPGGAAIAVTDVDDDGDEDFFITGASGATRLVRNDGGNSNLAVNVELKALRTGSGKNNTFGIGSKLELRTGDIYQTRVATSRVTHFGLGPHLKADVLRVEWPNGVPQTIYFPGSDQDVVESEMLKGSCALAYTWDGKQFRFVTDAMWRSALGMPLGLMGSTSAFAPAGASQEYVRIPGAALQPRDGRYLLQLTEELWETAYADQVNLIAVDHPDSVDVFVDEHFVPPGPVKLRVYRVVRHAERPPLSAVDDRGNDLLPALRASDDVYVSNLVPTRYQGVVEPHDLVLDLGPDAGAQGSFLFLRGWIYPTDASINVALSQQPDVKLSSPALDVRDASGRWRTAIPDVGFPSGKDKTMVIDLAGKFPTQDHHVRLRTSMQIYWDQAFVANDVTESPVKLTTLTALSADLHFRGFSRMYRKGGRYGPYWFDYANVTKDSPWRPIEGAFTRFGDILPLLRNPDDEYVIMGPGDEATLQFDASSATKLPRGWTRDFLLYTDGWIKDSDLNTAYGTTVEPLPFHRIKSYPGTHADAYPRDAEHDRYLREYNTRTTSRRK
jgi:cytochrome c-type biogenesis protein CcmH/NrfG